MRITKTNVIERIKAKTVYEGNCWRFTGKKTGRGYGSIWYEGRMVRIGRLICYLYHDMDLSNHKLEACHKDECKFYDCWNPDHLYPGSRKDNVRDQIRNNKFHYGTANFKFNKA